MKDEERKTKELRERLSQPTGKRPNMKVWLRANSAAKEFVELWLVMAAKGESDWIVSKVHRELINEYGMPGYRDLDHFRHWMRIQYADRFERAYEATR